jgi:hypothetical protein
MRKGVILPFRLSPARAQAVINETAQDTSQVILSDHALDRMDERGISDIEVYRILQLGRVVDEPTRTEGKEWKCKVIMRLPGSRTAGVITIILHDGMLFAMSVEWEDWR